MHELSIASAVAATAERHATGHRVLRVDVRVGHLRQVVVESLRFSFELVTRGTLLEGAVLGVEVVPARFSCGDCGHGWRADVPAFRCPECGGGAAEVVSGEELEVESIEIERQEERTCTG